MNRWQDREKDSARALKFEALKQSQEQKNRRRRAFYILLAAAAALSFFVVTFTVLLKVGEIEIKGLTVYGEEELTAALPFALGDSFYGFDSDAAGAAIKSQFPYIKTVAIQRRLPSTVMITLTEETPAFYLKAANGVYLVSENFQVLERFESPYENADLVFLSTGYVKRCVVGEKLSFAETKLLGSLQTLWQNLANHGMEDKIDYIEAQNRFDIYFGYEDRLRIYIGSAKECDTKIKFFEGIMEYVYADQSGFIDISNPKEATFSPDNPE